MGKYFTASDPQGVYYLCGQATPAASQRKILFKSTKKVIQVAVVKQNILAISTPGDDMINRTRDIESSVSRYATMVAIR
jgi:hypothetical protein